MHARAWPLFTKALARSVFVWTLINNHPIGNNRKEGSCARGADLSITLRVANRRELAGVRFRATPREEGLRCRAGWAWPGVRERERVRENKRMRGECVSARRALFPWIVLEREFAVWHVYTHQNRTKSVCTRYKEHKLQKRRRHPRVRTLRGTISWRGLFSATSTTLGLKWIWRFCGLDLLQSCWIFTFVECGEFWGFSSHFLKFFFFFFFPRWCFPKNLGVLVKFE